MPSTYILALDQGTTSSRSMLFDQQGNIVSMAQKEFKQHFPKPGWVEHDAEEIWSTQYGTLAETVAKANITMRQVAGIGITNQRETTVVWDRKTSKPIYPAIVWQDRRTASFCDELKTAGLANIIRERTGLVIDAYFSATKLKWILDNVPGAREKAGRGELAFGTIDTWLAWKLSGGELHITDVSNASRTLLLNIHTGEWDNDLLELFTIPRSLLPEVKPSSKIYGVTGSFIPDSRIPIAGIAGDQQAALFGQQCISPGMVKNTYGTGCFMLMNTGEKAIMSNNNLLTTIAWKINDKIHYALEGSVFIAGAVVQWLRDELRIIRTSAEVEALAAQVADSNGVYVVPAFAGLGAPYWNAYAKGSIFGLTRGSSKAHIARAALDSIAYQTQDVLKAMEADAGIRIQELRVDGGATINNQLMQFQSDILNTNVIRPMITETTALGAAYLAGLAVGYWKNSSDIQQQWKADKVFSPSLDDSKRTELIKGWHRAVSASIAWADNK
ncbi:glycerol kinase GlpK [Terrimonas sp. NA20]|uniref:Glycerol kinase n=1 Tax=Terrimonas ginsenosidimutans TaxID=2908004 RepID=A0ABS9KZZ2_9BACT|nr:glycerol kinase GlpK [Terrimonas ginsenosidimutans]MCG2617885.1 glycerol kinase GlpK [Terrimonas ginsenosidimutans]